MRPRPTSRIRRPLAPSIAAATSLFVPVIGTIVAIVAVASNASLKRHAAHFSCLYLSRKEGRDGEPLRWDDPGDAAAATETHAHPASGSDDFGHLARTSVTSTHHWCASVGRPLRRVIPSAHAWAVPWANRVRSRPIARTFHCSSAPVHSARVRPSAYAAV
jgi:hypothetical protein